VVKAAGTGSGKAQSPGTDCTGAVELPRGSLACTIRTGASPSGRSLQIFDRFWTLSEVRRSVCGSTSAVIDQNAGVRENRPRADTRPWIMSP
jgi:hypothetical protein